jgi:hypothetical protein
MGNPALLDVITSLALVLDRLFLPRGPYVETNLSLSSFHAKTARLILMTCFVVVKNSTEGDIGYLKLSRSILIQNGGSLKSCLLRRADPVQYLTLCTYFYLQYLTLCTYFDYLRQDIDAYRVPILSTYLYGSLAKRRWNVPTHNNVPRYPIHPYHDRQKKRRKNGK